MEQWGDLLYYRLMSNETGVASLRVNMAPQVHYCLPDWHWQPSPLPDYDFWFVESGRGEMKYGDQVITLERGVCFLWRPGDEPEGVQHLAHPLAVFACHFTPYDEQGHAVEAPEVPYPLKVRDLTFFVALAHRIEKLWRRGDEAGKAGAQDLLLAMLWQLWDETVTPAGPRDELIEELAGRIRLSPERKWRLDEMAASCHLSRAQFTRRFRAALRTSPTRFVIEQRVERAQQYLLETDMTLERIAGELGYEDAQFFSRQFRQVTGIWPGAARRR